jgi:hypothetical protein
MQTPAATRLAPTRTPIKQSKPNPPTPTCMPVLTEISMTVRSAAVALLPGVLIADDVTLAP